MTGEITMKRMLAGITVVLMLVAMVQAQAGLTGTWQGETGNGAKVVLELKAGNATMTGTLTLNQESAAITDGKVSKNTFTFTATVDGRTGAYAGELAGDQITVWPERQGRESAAVLKRVKQ
jgi:hypothetical protein